MKITASAPTRIDLAGGTLDIFPLYVFEGGGVTVNCAIDLLSTIEAEEIPGSRISIRSIDLNEEVEAESVEQLLPRGTLDLMMRAVKFCRPAEGLKITTKNNVPKGSGLGASSSLLVALMWSLQGEARKNIETDTFIDWCANVEAQSLGIPTGKQDYYAAFHGGLSAIFFDERGIRHEALKPGGDFMKILSSSLILSYTGISHFSGATNWDMMKSYIDNVGNTRVHMKNIKATAFRMREHLLDGDIRAVGAVLGEEWENRKVLAPGVTNRRIDDMVEAANSEGAYSSKICGAGGGGCLVTIAPPERRQKVIEALRSLDAEIMEFSLAGQGVAITSEAGAIHHGK
jgi:D-glycero-alpha-D-manno-heptose-7-phosphate kinase